jgi:hypothetical protein
MPPLARLRHAIGARVRHARLSVRRVSSMWRPLWRRDARPSPAAPPATCAEPGALLGPSIQIAADDRLLAAHGLLVTLLIRANRQGQQLLAFGLSDHYRQIFELTRLSEAIAIYDSESAALAAADAAQAAP